MNVAVQVFGCHTNPSHIQFKLELPSEEDQIICMAHVVTVGTQLPVEAY